MYDGVLQQATVHLFAGLLCTLYVCCFHPRLFCSVGDGPPIRIVVDWPGTRPTGQV